MRRILIIGATSTVAEATARRFAAAGDRLFLVARDAARLDAVAEDLHVRGAALVETSVMDAADYDRHEAVLARAFDALGQVDVALIAYGTLPDHAACAASFEATRRELETNFTSAVSLLTHLANRFEDQGRGTIAVISSVAGDRGRASNYVYGAAKAGLSAFLQGLRGRLHGSGVHVLTIKPGYVDTAMTAHLKKGVLWAQPEDVARGILAAIGRRRDVVYLPWFWRYVMVVIRLIPERLFKRLRL